MAPSCHDFLAEERRKRARKNKEEEEQCIIIFIFLRNDYVLGTMLNLLCILNLLYIYAKCIRQFTRLIATTIIPSPLSHLRK